MNFKYLLKQLSKIFLIISFAILLLVPDDIFTNNIRDIISINIVCIILVIFTSREKKEK